jgi:hypothetical protein
MYTELQERDSLRDISLDGRENIKKRILKFPNSEVIFAGNR